MLETSCLDLIDSVKLVFLNQCVYAIGETQVKKMRLIHEQENVNQNF